MTRILLDDGLLEVTGYWLNKFIGRVKNGPAFLSWRHYIDTMLDFCLEVSNIKVIKMLDLEKKSAIGSDNIQV